MKTKRSPLISTDFEGGLPTRGLFFGGGSGGGGQPSGNTTTTSTSSPWSGQVPYLNELFGAANDQLANVNPQFYPNSTAATLTPAQQQAIGLEQSTGLNNLTDPNSVANASKTQLAQTASGDFLPGGSAFDPYFNNFQQNVLSTVVPGLESQFNQGNSMNNPGTARAVSMGATDALGQLSGQLFETERGNQIKAAALAPQTQGLDLQNIAAISDAGSQQQNQQQQQLNDQIARWNFQQNLPYQKLNNYASLIQGGYGGTTTLSQPYFTNPLANGLTGAVGGGILGSLLGGASGIGSGYGAIGGAGLGSLLAFR